MYDVNKDGQLSESELNAFLSQQTNPDKAVDSTEGDFYQIAERNQNGKGTYYHRFYPFFVERYRSMPSMQMLEIGLDTGTSLNLWKEYFPTAKIWGMDILKKNFADERVEIFQAAQQDLNAMAELVNASSRGHGKFSFDFIVDDASHFPDDSIASFEYLFKHALEPGGTYVIEDLSTSYDQYEGTQLYGNVVKGLGRQSERNVVNYFREVAHLLNRRWDLVRSSPHYSHTYENADGKREPSTSVADLIKMVSFGQSSVYVVKKTSDEMRRFPAACLESENHMNGVCAE